jgi:hypothetical protein
MIIMKSPFTIYGGTNESVSTVAFILNLDTRWTRTCWSMTVEEKTFRIEQKGE